MKKKGGKTKPKKKKEISHHTKLARPTKEQKESKRTRKSSGVKEPREKKAHEKANMKKRKPEGPREKGKKDGKAT